MSKPERWFIAITISGNGLVTDIAGELDYENPVSELIVNKDARRLIEEHARRAGHDASAWNTTSYYAKRERTS